MDLEWCNFTWDLILVYITGVWVLLELAKHRMIELYSNFRNEIIGHFQPVFPMVKKEHSFTTDPPIRECGTRAVATGGKGGMVAPLCGWSPCGRLLLLPCVGGSL